MQKYFCRVAPSLGALEGTHQEVWGTEDYDPEKHINEPTVFMGLYGLNDFYALWRHQGEKHILWCGSDITHFMKGYWLEDGGAIKLCSKGLAKWINKNCMSWVENEVEKLALKCHGIESKVAPSFMGDINDFPISFKPGNKVYASVSGDNFELYGWDKIGTLAQQNPELEFHLYGNTGSVLLFGDPKNFSIYPPIPNNVIVHGRVPKEQMNQEIKEMQGGLRMTEFDGFSEIIVKSVLMGQWPISLIEYPHVLRPGQLSHIISKNAPNIDGHHYYRLVLNKYPWVTK